MNSKTFNVMSAGQVLLLSVALLLAATSANAQSSRNYWLGTSVFDEAGGTASSTNYGLAFTLGQPSPVGESESENCCVLSGYIYTLEVSFCGLKADVDSNCTINVLDLLKAVNYILDISPLDVCEFWRADCNDNRMINVLDVLGIANVILGIDTCPPHRSGSVAKAINNGAKVWSSSETLRRAQNQEPGAKSIELPVWVDSQVEIGGVQLKLSYDATQLSPGDPRLTERSSDMIITSQAMDGEMIILVYSETGQAMAAGSGPILTIPFTVQDSRSKTHDTSIQFSEVILAGVSCQAIPVEIHPISLKGSLLPATWSLSQNYPNPFNPHTDIRYQIADVRSPVHTTLKIYNILGQEVRTLVDEVKEPGYYTVTWDGKDGDGRQTASGIYFYRLTAGSFTATKRMVLMK